MSLGLGGRARPVGPTFQLGVEPSLQIGIVKGLDVGFAGEPNVRRGEAWVPRLIWVWEGEGD